MGRYFPPALLANIRKPINTITLLLCIKPITSAPAYGVTMLNRALQYDDGDGMLDYSASVGFVPSTIMAASGLSVDNAEAESLMPEFDVPVSESDIRAGLYDFARFSIYVVDFMDLSLGHGTLLSGTVGRVSIDEGGLSFINELRGLSAQLKQSVCTKDSLTCRAIFGSQPIGSSTPGHQVLRDWCGFDATTLLVAGAVTDVGLENRIVFTVDSFALAEDALRYGSVTFTGGLNAGRTYEVEGNTAGGEISLVHEAMFPIAIGDTCEYREGCNLQARDASHGCKRWFPTDWVLHFRGEPDIPIGDAGSIETPGASAGPGSGGAVHEPYQTVEE